MHFTGEVKGIEADFGNGDLLLFAEIHLQAQPPAAFHADVLAASLDESADFFRREIHSVDFDDHFEVEPVDLFIDHFEGDLGFDRFGFECGEVFVGADLDLGRERLEPVRVFFGEILRHPGAVASKITVVGRLHRSDEAPYAALEIAVVAVEDIGLSFCCFTTSQPSRPRISSRVSSLLAAMIFMIMCSLEAPVALEEMLRSKIMRSFSSLIFFSRATGIAELSR